MSSIGAATIYAISVLFSLLVLGLYILGAARYLTNLEDNSCEMTYMFEYPQYVRIALKDDVEYRYPRFGLYAYGEGFVTEKHRRMKFSGIPVLFVPGNAGSHEQVRSLASVSLRKSIKDRTPFHFDYFTISFGKDLSAFYGGVLEDETTYVSLCINKVLSLYKGKIDKLVLIGHSMGGIVAKAAILQGFIPPSSNITTETEIKGVTNILVTLASPHRPIFLPDRTIALFYENLETSMRNQFKKIDTSLVSIGGGRRDVLVSSAQIMEPSADLNIISSGIPNVWKSTDHLCILWCKQLVFTVVRALFDCVDTRARPPKITSDSELKARALSYHFTSRIFGKKMRPYDDKVTFERGSEWTEDIRRQYTWSSKNTAVTDKTVYLMIRVGDAAMSYDSIGIETMNLEARDWLFACSAHAIEGDSRVCEWGWNLTNRTSLLPDPTQRYSRKTVDIRLEDLRGWKVSHVVVRIPVEELRNRKTTPLKINIDLYNRKDRIIRLHDRLATGVTGFFKLLPLGRILLPDFYGITTSEPGYLRYFAELSGIEDAVVVEIEPRQDEIDSFDRSSTLEKNNEFPQATFELIEPSTFDQSYRSTSQVRSIVADIKKDGQFARKRTVMYLSEKNEDANLRITLHPEYSYRIIVRRAGIVDRIACSVRDRWPIVYPIIVALCLLGIAMRLDGCSRMSTITIVISIVVVVSFDFLFETLVAIGLLHVVAITTCFLVIFFGSVAHSVTSRFLARIVSLPSLWFDWLLGGFDRLPILTTFILLSLTSATCGAIAILISVPLYFLKLTKMYEEYLEELFMASLRHFIPRFGQERRKRKRRSAGNTSATTTDIPKGADGEQPSTVASTSGKASRETLLNHLLLFVTWSFAAIPAMPSALVWAKNFRYETRLTTEDPTMLISWLVLTCWGSLGLVKLPTSDSDHRRGQNRRKFFAIVLRLVAWFIAITAAIENSAYYQWTIPPLVAFSISCLALLSLFPGEFVEDNHRAIEN